MFSEEDIKGGPHYSCDYYSHECCFHCGQIICTLNSETHKQKINNSSLIWKILKLIITEEKRVKQSHSKSPLTLIGDYKINKHLFNEKENKKNMLQEESNKKNVQKEFHEKKSEKKKCKKENIKKVGYYTREERKKKIERWREKKKKIRESKVPITRYRVRKNFADSRPRIGGRFIKMK